MDAALEAGVRRHALAPTFQPANFPFPSLDSSSLILAFDAKIHPKLTGALSDSGGTATDLRGVRGNYSVSN